MQSTDHAFITWWEWLDTTMSFVQVKDRSRGSSLPSGGLVDRTPFYGARVPDEVRTMLKAMKGTDPAIMKKTLKCKDYLKLRRGLTIIVLS